ncbi:hypothetical protein H8959_009277 [Pygathrix nigripes]
MTDFLKRMDHGNVRLSGKKQDCLDVCDHSEKLGLTWIRIWLHQFQWLGEPEDDGLLPAVTVKEKHDPGSYLTTAKHKCLPHSLSLHLPPLWGKAKIPVPAPILKALIVQCNGLT